ncbi:MAG: exodeoxyribonuclease III [Planctomycetota bacterium]
MKLLSWNVNGLRAASKKGLLEWMDASDADVVCLQETKAHPDQLPAKIRERPGWATHFDAAKQKGYSGVGLYLRSAPDQIEAGFGVKKYEGEGRVLVARYPELTLFNVYFPNGKRDASRLEYKLKFYDAILKHWEARRRAGEELVICGDFNTAHREIDLARPKNNKKTSGFLPEERAWIDKLLRKGYVDTFRHFSDETDRYTWWDTITRARERNVGWRIDYFFVTKGLLPKVKRAWIEDHVLGSDHCPVGLELDL